MLIKETEIACSLFAKTVKALLIVYHVKRKQMKYSRKVNWKDVLIIIGMSLISTLVLCFGYVAGEYIEHLLGF